MHDHSELKFPDNFLWGAGTSAFQVEGNTKDSDWWEWEQTAQPPEKRSGLAANQYELYEQDFQLAKDLGHNAHRLGIEWSRIEPREGEFDTHEIEHYIKLLKYLKSLNIKVMLTLHHFSNPAWFAHKGGWTSSYAPYYFERFVKRIVPELKEYVDLWVTINEPGTYIYLAYHTADFPPQKKSKWLALKAYYHMAQAHKKAYHTIHQIIPEAKVGMAQNTMSFGIFHHHSLLEHLTEWFYDTFNNHLFYKLTGNTHDFIGLNYYLNQYISFNGEARLPSMVDISKTKKDVSDLGWEIYPEGIFNILMDFSDYHLPIYITENGIATDNDDRRIRFLLDYLKEIYHAIATGVDVKGYFYWSLIDNMELHNGFDPKFGLIEVDFKSQTRTPRLSALVYKEIIRQNGIPHKLLKLLGHGLDVASELKDIIKKDH